MSGEVNTNVYKDPYGNTAESIRYHSDGSEIKDGITTFADGKHAVVYDGKSDISVFLNELTGKKYSKSQINDFIDNADRQNDSIQYKATTVVKRNTPLEEGDVIILDEDNVQSVNKYKQQLATEEKENAKNEAIKAQEEKLAQMKKNNWSIGIGLVGGGISAGLGIAAICLASGPLGWAALGVAGVTGAIYAVRWRHNTIKEEKDKLEELKGQE